MADERETAVESGEEQIDATGRNPTQQRMDEEGVEPAPVDASWSEGSEGEGAPVAAAGPAVPGGSFEPGGAANEPVFEPDVPLVAEVNREAGGKSRKGLVAAVAGAFALLAAVLLRKRR